MKKYFIVFLIVLFIPINTFGIELEYRINKSFTAQENAPGLAEFKYGYEHELQVYPHPH